MSACRAELAALEASPLHRCVHKLLEDEGRKEEGRCAEIEARMGLLNPSTRSFDSGVERSDFDAALSRARAVAAAGSWPDENGALVSAWLSETVTVDVVFTGPGGDVRVTVEEPDSEERRRASEIINKERLQRLDFELSPSPGGYAMRIGQATEKAVPFDAAFDRYSAMGGHHTAYNAPHVMPLSLSHTHTHSHTLSRALSLSSRSLALSLSRARSLPPPPPLSPPP
jgi:hypothetical protein